MRPPVSERGTMKNQGFDLNVVALQARWNDFVEYAGSRWLPSIGVILAAILAYVIGRAVFTRIQKRIVTKTATDLDDHVVLLLRRAFLLSAVMWALWRLFSIWSLDILAQWVVAAWIGLLFIPISRFVGEMLTTIETQFVQRNSTAIDDTALPLLNTVVRFLILALGIILALDHIGLNIAPLLAGAGVMGLALSLAAKDTLSNLIAGVLLIIDRPFQVGDRIELWMAPSETGTWGDVIEIGLRATKIRNPDNLVVVVPNNEIMRRDIINYTMSGSDIRLRIPFGIAYESDIEKAKDLLISTAREVNGVKLDPLPIVIVRGCGPSEVKLQLRVWIEDARARRRIADEITEQAILMFSKSDVEIPYPKQEIYLRSMEKLQSD